MNEISRKSSPFLVSVFLFSLNENKIKKQFAEGRKSGGDASGNDNKRKLH